MATNLEKRASAAAKAKAAAKNAPDAHGSVLTLTDVPVPDKPAATGSKSAEKARAKARKAKAAELADRDAARHDDGSGAVYAKYRKATAEAARAAKNASDAARKAEAANAAHPASANACDDCAPGAAAKTSTVKPSPAGSVSSNPSHETPAAAGHVIKPLPDVANASGVSAATPTKAIPADTSADNHSTLPLLLGVLGGGALLAGAAAGGKGGDAPSAPQAMRTLDITVVAGPLTEPVKVEVFDTQGRLLGSGTSDAKGHAAIDVPLAYSGPVLIKTTGTTAAGIAYRDEATGQVLHFVGSLRAMVMVGDGNSVTFSVTPVSEMAVQKMAAAGDVATADAASVNAINHAVAAVFGLDDAAGAVSSVEGGTFLEADGVSAAERFGRVLAMLSGADRASGGMAITIARLAASIDAAAATIDTAGQDLLASGSAVFESGPNAALAELIVNAAPHGASTANARAAASALSAGASGDGTVDSTEAARGMSLAVALPGTVVAGNTVTVTLPAGSDGAVQTASYSITVADVIRGYASVPFTAAQLFAAGNGSKAPKAVFSSAFGASAATDVGAFSLQAGSLPPEDTSVQPVALRLAAGHDSTLNSRDLRTVFEVRYDGLAVGDRIQPVIGAVAIGTAHVVDAAELTAGRALLTIALADFGADGVQRIAVRAMKGDESYGSNTITMVVDATTPLPTLAPAPGGDAYLNASESKLAFELSYAGMARGDVIELKLTDGNAAAVRLGNRYTVTAADVSAGHASFSASRAELGANGVKAIGATVTDAAGNVGTAASLMVTVDGVAPAPVIAVAAGQDGRIGAHEAGVDIVVTYAGLAAGDVIQLQSDVDSNGVVLAERVDIGATYVVTAADVLSGAATVNLARASLGADALRPVVAKVSDPALNVGVSNAISIELDTALPVPIINVVAGEDAVYVNAADSAVGVEVRYVAMAVGDTLELLSNGVALSGAASTHVVQQSDVASGMVLLSMARADLGSDGAKSITVKATDAAANVGSSATLSMVLDSTVPSPWLSVSPGADNKVNAAEDALMVQVGYAGMSEGDVIALHGAGNAPLSTVTVNAMQAIAQLVDLRVERADLGGDGAYTVAVTATDLAGNSSGGNVLDVIVDATVPAPAIAIAGNDDANLNAHENGIGITLSYAGMEEGDLLQLTESGVALGAAYVVNAQEAAADVVTLGLLAASLGNDGAKAVQVVATDAAGNSARSAVLDMLLDRQAPAPSMTLSGGQDMYIGSREPGVGFDLRYAGMRAGDVIVLRTVASGLAPSPIGVPYVVSDADAGLGVAQVALTRGDLGNVDGAYTIDATVTDMANNQGVAAPVGIVMDTQIATPTLGIVAPADAYVNASEGTLSLRIEYADMTAGDVISLRDVQSGQNPSDASNPLMEAPHVVTQNEAAAHAVVRTLPRANFGADGTKNLAAIAVDAAGNVASSGLLAVTVDTSIPRPELSAATGFDLTINDLDAGLELEVRYAGLAAGDRIQLHDGATALGGAYTVTAADAALHMARVSASVADLHGDGIKHVTATATDLSGNSGTSSALTASVDTTVPNPRLDPGPNEDLYLNATETSLHLHASYAGMAIGDSLQLTRLATSMGPSHVVDAADMQRGSVIFTILKQPLGADGIKPISVEVTDVAGNVGTGNAALVNVDSVGYASASLNFAPGHDAFVNSSDPVTQFYVAYADMTFGDHIQLQSSGVAVGSLYAITRVDDAANLATLSLDFRTVAGDGMKDITASVMDAAGNPVETNVLQMSVDTSIPMPVISLRQHEDAVMGDTETSVHAQIGYAGMARGDVIQLSEVLSSGGVGPLAYVLTDADVAAHAAEIEVTRAWLGADGIKSIFATAVDLAGNTGSSAAFMLTLDQSIPVVI
ncbi:hypothetical protein BH09PSE5_BH09PSE5_13060 [soil metagenome]